MFNAYKRLICKMHRPKGVHIWKFHCGYVPKRMFSNHDIQKIIQEQIEKDERDFLPKSGTDKSSELVNKFDGVKDLNQFQMKEVDTYDEGEKDLRAVDETQPISLRERKQTALVYETFKEKA